MGGIEFLSLIFIFVVLPLYFLPTILANRRDHPQFQGLLVANIFLGWTFLGWVVCLVWSLKNYSKEG